MNKRIVTAVFVIIFWGGGVCRSDDPLQGEYYKSIASGKMRYEVAICYSDHIEPTEMVVSAFAIGKGVDLRRWEVTDMKLHVGKNIIRPVQNDKIYTTQESILRYPATVLYAVTGALYHRNDPAATAVSSGIDRVGMSTGLGLLATQAKGDITGLKSRFELDREEMSKGLYFKEGSLRIVAENRERNLRERVSLKLSDLKENVEKGKRMPLIPVYPYNADKNGIKEEFT